MKIVINSDHGGFGLSHKAMMLYADKKGIKLYCDKGCMGFNMYYRVPIEEFKKISAEDKKKNYFEASNDLCFSDNSLERNDPILIEVVEELKEKANDCHASLKIVEIPDGVDWQIDEYDGAEWVAEKHRTWH